jgi:hypothetical protein
MSKILDFTNIIILLKENITWVGYDDILISNQINCVKQ